MDQKDDPVVSETAKASVSIEVWGNPTYVERAVKKIQESLGGSCHGAYGTLNRYRFALTFDAFVEEATPADQEKCDATTEV